MTYVDIKVWKHTDGIIYLIDDGTKDFIQTSKTNI